MEPQNRVNFELYFTYLNINVKKYSQILDGVLLLLFLPERQVLLEQLNNALGVTEGLFIDIVDLLQGVGESLLAELTGLLVVVHNLVVEHREVKSKSETDGVACVQAL